VFLLFFLCLFDNIDGNLLYFYISLEYISVCTCGFLSYSDNSYQSVLTYLWASIISAILSASILLCNLSGFSPVLIVFLIYFYFSIKVGLLPFGYWLFFFYNTMINKNLIAYLSSFYIINILYVYFFLSIILTMFVNLNVYFVLYKFYFVGINFLFAFIFFINSYNLRIFFLYNTLTTASIVYSIL